MTQIGTFNASARLTMARGRNGDLYGVNGVERGFRWNGSDASVEQLGISPPASAPTVTSTEGTPKYFIQGINVIDGGYGYSKEPTVLIDDSSGSEDGATGAKAKAYISDGRLQRVVMQDYGTGYTSAPDITLGDTDDDYTEGSGATLTVTGVSGKVDNINYTQHGSGYSSVPSVSVAAPGAGTSGMATIAGREASYASGRINFRIVYPGTGYTSAPAITVSGGSPTTPYTLSALMAYRVTEVTVTNGGSGYKGRPRVKFTPATSDVRGYGAEAVCEVTNGVITGVTVTKGGSYSEAPTAEIDDRYQEQPRSATVKPVMRAGIKGKYWCAYRYVDDTAEADGGPIPSSISEFAEIELSEAVQQLNWSGLSAGSEPRVNKIELWRTTADQALALYRVATIDADTETYTDTLGDQELANPEREGFKALPVVLPNGQPNARRFRPPPQNKSAIAMFQDRAWYAVDAPGRKYDGTTDADHSEPNTLYFSEVDEPESVPEPNQLILQDNVNGDDRITAIMPFGGGMVVFQDRHCYRLTYAAQPIIDANFSLMAQRGCFNQRCFATHDGVAYVADAVGMYVIQGSSVVPISDGIDTYWTSELIHFPSSSKFYVCVDPVTRIARFFFSATAGDPDRALCYHPVTKAWWEEQYAQDFGASTIAISRNRPRLILGGQSGSLLAADTGYTDLDSTGSTADISAQYRTGNFSLAPNAKDRSLRVLYSPLASDTDLVLKLHYNNSSTPRAASIATNLGTGFTTANNGHATLNLSASRSALGTATGYAIARYSGRVDDRSSGTDRHIAVDVSVTSPDDESTIINGLAISGVGQ